MKKGFLALFFIWTVLPLCAQSGIVKKGVQAVADSEALYNTLSANMQRQVALNLRGYFLTTRLEPTPQHEIQWEVFLPTEAQKREGYSVYLRALKATRALSRLLQTKLYYQGLEFTPLCELEISRDLSFVNKTQRLLRQASMFVSQGVKRDSSSKIIWRGDPALTEARRFVEGVSRFYEMCATGQIFPLEEPEEELEKVREKFNPDVFFLHNPRKIKFFEWLFQRKNKGAFPSSLRVAAVVDPFIFEELLKFQKKEKLSGWTLEHYDNPEAFLNTPGHLSYDLVLSDVLIKNGGGKYLARMLRQQNFEGSIVAMSGYSEDEKTGMRLMAAGMDGMIYSGAVLYHQVLRQLFKNFFYYKSQRSKDTGDGKK